MSKYNYFLILFIFFIFSCGENNSGQLISELTGPILLTLDANDTLYQNKDLDNLKYCLLDNRKAEVIDGNTIKLDSLEVIKVMVYGTEFGNLKTIEQNLNILLLKTRFGCQVILDSFPDTKNVLDEILTEGKINTNNIIHSLDSFEIIDNTADFHIYLFNKSEFFNTANAITLKSDDFRIIMGDKDLLQTEMLLLHEMGHAFGLTHNNEYYEDCDLYNVMHESNIGCSRIFTYRQSLMTTHQTWIEKVDKDQGGMPTDVCKCAKETDPKIDLYEAFVNSFDKNIDDTPAADNIALLGKHYLIEIKSKSPSLTVLDRLSINYGNEYDYYFEGTGTLTIRGDYIKKRVTTHKKLRRNNLLRWLNNERAKTGLKMETVKDLDLLPPSELNDYVDETVNIRSSDVIAQIKKHEPIIIERICNLLPPSNCLGCKDRFNWKSLDEITYDLCWQVVGERLCAEVPPQDPNEVINTISQILTVESDIRTILINKLTEELTEDDIVNLIAGRNDMKEDFKSKIKEALNR